MSVTIADLLSLPCLREARVLGGVGGLQKTVSTISVLEYSETDGIQGTMLETINFLGGELVITCFAGVKDDIPSQCTNIRRLADVGEIGIILYYVGVIMPRVDAALIELADRLDFPLICMPENRPNLRYSEVISEVMDAIFKDRMTDTHFQGEILERISRLPPYQRSIGTAMGMLSDRVRVSLLLTDASGNLLNSVCWPRTLELDPEEIIARRARGEAEGRFRVLRCPVNTAAGSRLDLYVVKQDEPPGEDAVRQITEVLRICINFRNEKYGAQVLPELVQAILQDEPFRMRRIAGVFRIDVASLHTMWIITPAADKGAGRDPQGILSLLREELSAWCKTMAADIYNQDIVAFTDNPPEGSILPLAESFSDSMYTRGINAVLTVCFNLKDTGQVRRAYLQNKNALASARALYPHRRFFSRQEIGFAESCQNLISQGEAAAQDCVSILDCLDTGDLRQSEEFRHTLSVYLLDADSSLEACAQKLFLHRNTIKYRINRINDRLGFKLGDMPGTMELYTAAAVRRILEARQGPAPR
jgi:hypothetical protein